MLNRAITGKLSGNYILEYIFAQCFSGSVLCRHTGLKQRVVASSAAVHRQESLNSVFVAISVTLSHSLAPSLVCCLLSVGCTGVSTPLALHMVKISEGNQGPSRSGPGP